MAPKLDKWSRDEDESDKYMDDIEFPFQRPTLHRIPSQREGVDIELPDFDKLFDLIQKVSPLAQSVIARNNCNMHQNDNHQARKGFDTVDDSHPSGIKWKIIHTSKKGIFSEIAKVDNFNGDPVPLMRFRGSMEGPCFPELFATLLMDYEERVQWDSNLKTVYEIYPIPDLNAVNLAMGLGKYGHCTKLGVGYSLSKKVVGISARELLTLCGIQDFDDGSCIIWGTEMDEKRHNDLMPPGPRVTRAKAKIFYTTMTPTSDDTFDMEYVVQISPGGSIPSWITTPLVSETVKNFFQCVEKHYKGKAIF